ncbi:MAG: MaoC/PaaZ C-terminal domain-containing protein [Nocardioides sp.]|uniref:MaoC/PaaZ C-terminal domain-containing protein n=1 Tax=Nocardioides sp. TaxID=35761 RepID=UPI003267DC27
MTIDEVHAAAVAVGDTWELLLVNDLRRTRLVQYAGASGDFNPVHSDDVNAREVAGLPGVFAHGMLTMGMTGRVVTDVFGVARVEHFGGRFTAQVWPGDTLIARATVDAINVDERGSAAQLSIATVNQHGVEVLRGRAVVRLPH